jgi:hypothetical protein
MESPDGPPGLTASTAAAARPTSGRSRRRRRLVVLFRDEEGADAYTAELTLGGVGRVVGRGGGGGEDDGENGPEPTAADNGGGGAEAFDVAYVPVLDWEAVHGAELDEVRVEGGRG